MRVAYWERKVLMDRRLHVNSCTFNVIPRSMWYTHVNTGGTLTLVVCCLSIKWTPAWSNPWTWHLTVLALTTWCQVLPAQKAKVVRCQVSVGVELSLSADSKHPQTVLLAPFNGMRWHTENKPMHVNERDANNLSSLPGADTLQATQVAWTEFQMCTSERQHWAGAKSWRHCRV